MSNSMLIFASTLFSLVWGASMFIVDSRQDSRQIETIAFFRSGLDSIDTNLQTKFSEEISKYQRVFTVQEIIEMVNAQYITDVDDLKLYLINENTKEARALAAYIKKKEEQYDTVYYEDAALGKYRWLGYDILGEYYLLKEEQIDSFPFEL